MKTLQWIIGFLVVAVPGVGQQITIDMFDQIMRDQLFLVKTAVVVESKGKTARPSFYRTHPVCASLEMADGTSEGVDLQAVQFILWNGNGLKFLEFRSPTDTVLYAQRFNGTEKLETKLTFRNDASITIDVHDSFEIPAHLRAKGARQFVMSAFVLPKDTDNLQLIATDQYGNVSRATISVAPIRNQCFQAPSSPT